MTEGELMQQLGRENVYQEGQPARYQEYQLPGAEPGSYRELLLRLPKPRGDKDFTSSHFSEPNILSHVRFNDRTGPDGEKILFLEELQSDWHREGRDQGYRGAYPTKLERHAVKSGMSPEQARADIKHLLDEPLDKPGRRTSDQWKRLTKATDGSDIDLNAVFHDQRDSIVPDAPFKSSWHELTLKRMLRHAAENGYDKLAFIDGKKTADRYDLSKKIDGLEVIDLDDGTYEILAKEVGDDAYRTLANNVEKDKVEDYIGKEVAKTAFDKMDDGLAHLEGVDLKVGGDWAFNLYDRMIPQFLKKYGKKFGAKVEDVEVVTDFPEYDSGRQIPRDSLRKSSFKAIDITPQMRGEEGVLGGQARFMPAERNDRKNRVSTRLPTAVAATEDPLASTLLIGNDTIMMLPPEKQKVMAGIIANYPHIKTNKRDLPVVGDELMDMSVSNLLWLYDKVPEDVRKRSKLWYDGARKITNDWVKKYGTSNAESAGVIAVLSPQKDWFMNVSLAERVIDAYKNKQDVAVNQDMIAKALDITQFNKDELILKVIRSMKNKKYADLDPLEKAYFMRLYDQTYRPQSFPVISPEGKMLDVKMNDNGTVGKVIHASSPAYMKAISILENPTKENISTQLGGQHKVRNFNNNILLPKLANEDVTIDTHAVAAALLKPLSAKSIEVGHNFGSGVPNSSVTGGKGTYGIYADAYRKAAKQRGVMPREMQSITWEAVRGLFPQRMKNKKNNKIVDDIWGEYNRGEISLDETRDRISDAFGGIRNPSWYGRDK